MLRASVLVLSVAALVFLGTGAVSAIPYYLTDLGPASGGTVSYATALALVGGSPQAVGLSQGSTATDRVPVAWISGTATSLLPSIPGASAGLGNQANGINGNGDIVGQTLVSGVQSAFYLPSGGTATVLPLLPSGTGPASAAGLTSSGVVVGYTALGTYWDGGSNSYQPCPHAFVWSASTGMVDLGVDGVPTWATAISADGNTIVGDYNAAVGQQGIACKWTKSGSTWTRTNLVPQGLYNQSVAQAINSSGDIVGSLYNYPSDGFPNPDVRDMLIKQDGTIVNLLGLGSLSPDWHFAYARGINDSGVIVGNEGTSVGKALVNYAGVAGADVDLNTLLSPISGAGWSLSYAYGIDNNGDIVGRGKNSSGITHGYLLKPAMAGDANLDGTVNINDLSKVLTNYDKTGMQWADGDFDGGGTVNINDLSKVLTNYDKTASAAAGIHAVPEPSTLLLLAIGLIAYAWRKRK
jgi:hypothetical protein